jgi:fatty-acyl-CoA synthase
MYHEHSDWIKTHAERTPDKLALVDLATGREYTYQQFNERANRLTSFLKHTYDLGKGSRVSILAKNSSEYFETIFGCAKMGAVLNTLNWRLAVPELHYILTDFGPQVLIYDAEFKEAVEALKPTLSDCFVYIMLNGQADEKQDIPYESALAKGEPKGIDLPDLSLEDTWCLLYTSGTTGKPKGAMITYGNVFLNAVSMGQTTDLTSNDVNLTYLPCFHTGGIGLYAAPVIYAGGTVVVGREFDPVQMLRAIEKYRASIMILVPSMYLMLDQLPEFDRYDLSSMRYWSSGGSPLPTSLVHLFAEKRDIIIQQGFGMTECGPTVFLITKEDAVRKAGSLGKPVMHTHVCVMDKEGKKLGPNQVGELCIRGNITSGYWKKPGKNGRNNCRRVAPFR